MRTNKTSDLIKREVPVLKFAGERSAQEHISISNIKRVYKEEFDLRVFPFV
jgi:hypothetical protein